MTGTRIPFVDELARLKVDKIYLEKKVDETNMMKYKKQLNRVLNKINEVENEM